MKPLVTGREAEGLLKGAIAPRCDRFLNSLLKEFEGLLRNSNNKYYLLLDLF